MAKQDFLRVRDLLVSTFSISDKPINWRFERWNYARYFAAPFLGAFGLGNEPVTDQKNADENSRKAIKFWEDSIGIWENETHEIVGVVCPDEHIPWHPVFGQFHIQRRPGYTVLLNDMLSYAEKTYANDQIVRVRIFDHDLDLLEIVQRRGYKKSNEFPEYHSEYIINEMPASFLPPGFIFRSMADNNDLEKRREIFGRAFRHPDPKDWPTVFSYEELQRAPDYRKTLDLYVVGPNGNYVSCCIVWYDEKHKAASLEPVGSILLGMGREVVMEGIRRVAALGAKSVWVGSAMRFYMVIGFKKRYVSNRWIKRI